MEDKNAAAITRLQVALEDQRSYLRAYEKPSEPLAFETLRMLDDLFCRELMEPERHIDKSERMFRSHSTWGVNHALRRIVPREPESRTFRYFPSYEAIQAQADDFVFNCGVLQLAERLEGWLREGIVSGELRRHQRPGGRGLLEVVVLRSAVASYLDEEISMAGLRWESAETSRIDLPVERALEARHLEWQSELEARVALDEASRVVYSSTREIDCYFSDWARLYLRRMFSQDMIAPDDVLGCRPFSRYLEVLTSLSARSQKHIAFAAIIRARHRSVHIRNLLTTFASREALVHSLAQELDADSREIESILASFVLNGANLDAHTIGDEPAWAPIVQASRDTLLVPAFGLDINPFLFLLTDLRSRYESDWFKVANNREQRWIQELEALFSSSRWNLRRRSLRLRIEGKDLTDIDFVAHDSETNELALFQLKWQQPVGLANRSRRSAGKNLIDTGNRWVEAVGLWLESNGADELMRKLALRSFGTPTVRLFVLGRYHVHLSGMGLRDSRAAWSDWAHFKKAITEGNGMESPSQIASRIASLLGRAHASKKGESFMLPVGNIGLVLNPTSVPSTSSV
jgi:hypothetical protein